MKALLIQRRLLVHPRGCVSFKRPLFGLLFKGALQIESTDIPYHDYRIIILQSILEMESIFPESHYWTHFFFAIHISVALHHTSTYILTYC